MAPIWNPNDEPVDRVILGHLADSDSTGLWVSKAGANVSSFAGNAHLQSIGTWYGLQEEFEGDGTDGPSVTSVESFSGFTSAGTGGVTTNRLKRTANGTIFYGSGIGDQQLYTPQWADGSFNPSSDSFIGAEYPIVEMRVRRRYGVRDFLFNSAINPDGSPTIGGWLPHPSGGDMQLFFEQRVIGDGSGADTMPMSEPLSLNLPGTWVDYFPPTDGAVSYADYLAQGGTQEMLRAEFSAGPGFPGPWKIIRWDMQNTLSWMDPYAHNGFSGPHSSEYRVTQLRFDFNNDTISTDYEWQFIAPETWNPETHPMYEIDYVRVLQKDIPKNVGKYGNYNDSIKFDSNWHSTGLVHQTGIVTIGTAKALINGNTSNRVVGHNIDNDANGYVTFPALDYIPLILFQRLDENYETTGATFLSGEDEFSICETTWEDNRYPTIDMNTSEPSWKGYDIKMVNYGLRDGSGKLLNDPLSSISSLAYYNNSTGSPIDAKENFYVSTSHPPSGLPTNPASSAGSNWNAPFNTGTGSTYWDTYWGSTGEDLPRPEVEDWRGFGGIWDAYKDYREESFARRSDEYIKHSDIPGYIATYMLDDPGMTPTFYGQNSDSISRGKPTFPNFEKTFPPFSERSKITNTTGDVISGYRKWSDLKSSFYETRTFAYARAKKDGFWLTCRNAIAQEGMEPVLNLAPTFPEESKGIAVQGHLAYTTMLSNTDNGAWGMFHPALVLYDDTKFTEGLQLKWDSTVTANSFLLDKVGEDEDGNFYNQYKWWPNFSCSGLIFDGELAAPTATLNSLSDITGDTTTYTGYSPGIRAPGTGHFKTSYAKVVGKYDAQYTSDGILGDTVDFNSEGFYPYRTQCNPVYHEHLNAGGSAIPWPSAGSIDLQIYGAGGSTVELGNINATPPTSPKFRYADSDRNQNYSSTPGTGLHWNPVESAVVDGARVITQYNYKRISSTGIRHPEGIVPSDQGSGDNRNIGFSQTTYPTQVGTLFIAVVEGAISVAVYPLAQSGSDFDLLTAMMNSGKPGTIVLQQLISFAPEDIYEYTQIQQVDLGGAFAGEVAFQFSGGTVRSPHSIDTPIMLPYVTTTVENQTAYIGGAMNIKDSSVPLTTTASFDKTKTNAPKYRYWVLRIPMSIPEYTS